MWKPTLLRYRRLRTGLKLSRIFDSAQATSCSTTEDSETLRARLLYQSKKRGILENDLIIGGFARRHLAEMDGGELKAYDRIINGPHMEWDLFHYCAGKKKPPPELAECRVFQRICHFARNGTKK